MRTIDYRLALFVTILLGGCADDAGGGDAGADWSTDPAVVLTRSGPVRGTLGAKSRAFLGIPFAAPPTGALRFEAPRPHAGWSDVRDATQFGYSCVQPKSLLNTLKRFNEDCLTLNVWTPNPAPAAPAAVIVWIHGGGFFTGGAAEGLYDGQKLVEDSGEVIVVTLNYRLGALGFLSHPALPATAGTNGIQDQRAALTWVKNNIAAFGGDPANVTLMGQSAGSMSVGIHLTSPASKGLFHQVVLESGAPMSSLQTLTEARAQGLALAKEVGCAASPDAAACLRKATTGDLINTLTLRAGIVYGEGINWWPPIDDKTLLGQPMARIKAGAFNKVPVLLGTNGGEGTVFLLMTGKMSLTDTQYADMLVSVFGAADGARALAEYPASSFTTQAEAMAEVIKDWAFVCPTRRAARALEAAGVPVHLYHFTRKPSFALVSFLGSYHGAEIPFIFGHPPYEKTMTGDEVKLGGKMASYWLSYATKGAPAGAGPPWPAFGKAGDQHLGIDLTIKVGSGLKKKQCDFWDGIAAAP